MEPGRPLAQRLCQGGRQADVPPPPRGPEHGLHTGPRGLHPWPARMEDPLARPAAGHPRRGGRGHGRGPAAFGRLHGAGGRRLRVLGLGPGAQQTLPRQQKPAGVHLAANLPLLPGGGRVVCAARLVDGDTGHGRGHAELHGGRTVPGRGLQRPEGQEAVPHRQRRVGPLRGVRSLRQRAGSGAPPPHGPMQESGPAGAGQGAHPSHRHTPPATDSQELPPVPVTLRTDSDHIRRREGVVGPPRGPSHGHQTQTMLRTMRSRWRWYQRRPTAARAFVYIVGGVGFQDVYNQTFNHFFIFFC